MEELRPCWARIAGKRLHQGLGGALAAKVAQRVGRVAGPLRVVEELDQRRQPLRSTRTAQGAQPRLHPPLRLLVGLVLDGSPAADRARNPPDHVGVRP